MLTKIQWLSSVQNVFNKSKYAFNFKIPIITHTLLCSLLHPSPCPFTQPSNHPLAYSCIHTPMYLSIWPYVPPTCRYTPIYAPVCIMKHDGTPKCPSMCPTDLPHTPSCPSVPLVLWMALTFGLPSMGSHDLVVESFGASCILTDTVSTWHEHWCDLMHKMQLFLSRRNDLNPFGLAFGPLGLR